MKAKQFLRKLQDLGVQAMPGRGKGAHVRLALGVKRSVLAMHGAKDLDRHYMKEVCKQLGLDIRDVV